MKVYLAGPMTGYPDHNFPAFKAAAKDLRSRGITVYNPADRSFQQQLDESYDYYMQWELPAVCRADAVVVLPGWRKSKGARLEVHVGREVGKRILKYPELTELFSDEEA